MLWNPALYQQYIILGLLYATEFCHWIEPPLYGVDVKDEYMLCSVACSNISRPSYYKYTTNKTMLSETFLNQGYTYVLQHNLCYFAPAVTWNKFVISKAYHTQTYGCTLGGDVAQQPLKPK